jgi:acyl dehydratase
VTVREGERRELVAVDDLTRTQIVQYAGASGDYNPVHTDERYAVEAAGYPSVFAHGMLTMAMAGRVLSDWFGPGALLSYAARFHAPVFPGAALTAAAWVTSVDAADRATVALTMTNADGVTVLSGHAVVRTDWTPASDEQDISSQ